MPIISYEHLVEKALRSVLRDALEMAARDGLPGGHHFYITFHTAHPGVVIPPVLRAQHPQDMTIVVQHQYWNLVVEPDYFRIDLSFSGVRHTLHIPFDAVTAFADPFAKFGLQFQVALDDLTEGPDEAGEEDLSVVPVGDSAPSPEKADGNVVTLDAFRKK